MTKATSTKSIITTIKNTIIVALIPAPMAKAADSSGVTVNPLVDVEFVTADRVAV